MQIRDRSGSIEIAIANDDHNAGGRDLIWRIRVLEISTDDMLVEQPTTLGQAVSFETNVRLTGYMTVGQNRWMFQTRILGVNDSEQSGARPDAGVLRLLLPESVERCKRRNYFRLSTESLPLPKLEAWPLIDPSSVTLAERAMDARLAECSESNGARPLKPSDFDDILPDVGPRFTAILMNIGGGGLGLLVEPESAHLLNRSNALWLRLQLPDTDTPICAVGRVVHTHIESTQQTYAGIAFDFSFNPASQRVVAGQICRYIASQQAEQLRRSA